MRTPINTKGIQMIKVTCTDTGKTVDAEIFDIKPSQITVILPGFQKMRMDRVGKKDLYVANQFGMEFAANYKG